LSAESTKEWESIAGELKEFTKLKIPTYCILVDHYPVSLCLHGFSDTSKRAYAAALYLTSKYSDGHTEARLLNSKT